MMLASMEQGVCKAGAMRIALIAVFAAVGCSDGANEEPAFDASGGRDAGFSADSGGGDANTDPDGGADDGGTDAAPVSPDASCEGTPALDISQFDPCMKDNCMNAVCIPTGVIPEAQKDRLSACDDSTTCVPTELASSGPQFTPKTCESVAGFEGRCLSTCIPQIQDQADFLQQKSCDAGELCAPCYHPITGEETGACTATACDQPQEDKQTFQECCNGTSLCVPNRLVPEDQRESLPQAGCKDGQLCAPKVALNDEGQTVAPPMCDSIEGSEGRCLPECIPQVKQQADRLPKGSCGDGHLCAPCFNPVSGNQTPACTIADDEPMEDPYTFSECCGGKSLCVPNNLVPEGQRSSLEQGGCEGEHLCVPKNVLNEQGQTVAPPTCSSLGGVEGRCLPECVPEVAAQADRLPQASCGDGHLCAPCYNPVSGEQTAACTIGDDQPPAEPTTFPECCNGTSLCVPTNLVPEGQRENLGQGGCESDRLCVPKNVLNDDGDTVPPPTCDSLAGAPGRCLPTCVPAVSSQADLLDQGSCEDGHKCAPCYDPRTGDETAACTIADDSPPMQCESNANLSTDCTFKDCFVCTADGTQADTEDGMCVPMNLVGDSNRERLTQTSCGSGFLCAPKVIAKDQENGHFKRCSGLGPGACVPGCFVDSGQRAILSGAPCDKTNYVCAPCTNPLEGGACTGACQNTPDECSGSSN